MGIGSFIGSAFKTIAPAVAGTLMGGPAGGIIASAGSLLDKVTPSLIDLGSQYLGNKYITRPNSAYAWDQSREAAELSWNRTRDAYKTRYQDTMADMKSAGLNPILAASGGFNIGNPGQAPSPTGFMPHQPTHQASSSAKNVADISKINQETKKAIVDTRKSFVDVMHTMEQIKKTKGETAVIAQKVQNLLKEHARLVQQIIGGQLSNEQNQMKMRALRGIENDLKDPIKILEYLQSGKPGIAINNYVKETKNLLNSLKPKLKKLLNPYDQTYGGN